VYYTKYAIIEPHLVASCAFYGYDVRKRGWNIHFRFIDQQQIYVKFQANFSLIMWHFMHTDCFISKENSTGWHSRWRGHRWTDHGGWGSRWSKIVHTSGSSSANNRFEKLKICEMFVFVCVCVCVVIISLCIYTSTLGNRKLH